MATTKKKSPKRTPVVSRPPLSNADIAVHLLALAQLLSAQGANKFKVRAYRRGAETIKTLSDSVDELARRDADLTQISGIGAAISSAIREIVLSGTFGQLETLRAQVSPEVSALGEHPRLDPKRVLRIYKKLKIATVAELKAKLASGEVGAAFGPRMEQHVRSALTDSRELLLYDAEEAVAAVRTFLREVCGATRVEVAGDVRRRLEVISDLSFLTETADFPGVVAKFKGYGGRAALLASTESNATFQLSSGLVVILEAASASRWGLAWIAATGSERHLEKIAARAPSLTALAKSKDKFPTEASVYRQLGLALIEPELREGNDEVERAARGKLPPLVTLADIRGELHAHSTSSDGAHSIEQMAAAARERSYGYLGITDHSQSLKIAGGVSEDDLWQQIRVIDKLNHRLTGIHVLKSAEVDILADGSLDYPDALLRELDYTVCSIHSRFGLGKAAQTERILRAMDNPHFTILGHATGRLLLRRPGYEIEMERVIEHARQRGCFFEINASPDRLDLSAAHARLARDAGVMIAICTDAHSVHEFDFIRWGIDQARRAGLEKKHVLNCLSWPELRRVIKR